MAVSMTGPKFYAWDRDGKPLAFGKVYTYQARTNAPKETYQSEDGLVANDNPVNLNGEGYADIYLDGSYKIVVKDLDGNEIWTEDPVTARGGEEWVNCMAATYISATSYKITGYATDKFEVGRRVRIDNNAVSYGHSTILTSVFAGGETTVTLSDEVVTTGIINACVSIIGMVSLDLGAKEGQVPRNSDLFVDSVADMRNLTGLVNNQIVYLRGNTVIGKGFGQFRVKTADTTTPDNNGTVINANGVRLFRDYSGLINPEWFGAIGDWDGATGNDDTAAFQGAVNVGDIDVPWTAKSWLIGALSVPAGVNMFGHSLYKYTAFDMASILGLGAIVWDTNAATFITWGGRNYIEGCTFFGVDQSRPFQEGTAGNLHLFRTAVFRCYSGLGRNGANTLGNSRAVLSHFCGNIIGISSLTDSHVTNCEINANEKGVRITTGANDTVYMGNKVEWNNQHNWEIYGNQTSNQILGGVCDRAGLAGFSIKNSAGLQIDNVKIRRSGRLAENDQANDAHFVFESVTSDKLQITNCVTSVGSDDGGGGYNGGALTIERFVGNDLSDVALGDNITFNNAAANKGLFIAGQQVAKKSTGNVSAATNLTFSDLPVTPTYSRQLYELNIVTRQTDGGSNIQKLMLLCKRPGGNVEWFVLPVYEMNNSVVTTVGVDGVGGATVATDGTEVTLIMTPTEEVNAKYILTYIG